jgi:molybdopterin converting factor small subunit
MVFLIPGFLRQYTGGRARLEIEARVATVGEALAALWAVHPGVRDRVVDEQFAIRQHVNVFVGEENVRDLGGLATPVDPEDEISIVPAVSGG